jgi:hypothetical protein
MRQLDMGPRLTMVVGILQHGGFPFYNGILRSLVFFGIMVHNYPLDPGIRLYIKH